MSNGDIIHTHHVINDHGRMVFYANSLQMMMSIDVSSGELKKLFAPTDVGYSRVFELYEEEFYFFETFGKCVSKWNPLTQTGSKLSIPKDLLQDDENNWEMMLFRHGNRVYISGSYPTIVRYDLEVGEWKVFRYEECVRDRNAFEGPVQRPFAYKNKMYFALPNSLNRFIIIDCNTEESYFEEVSIPSNVEHINGCFCRDEELYIQTTNKDGSAGIYMGCINIQNDFHQLAQIKDYRWSHVMIAVENSILLLPCRSDHAYRINKKTGNIEELDIPIVGGNRFGNRFTNNYNYIRGISIEGKYYLIHPWTKTLLCIDEQDGGIERRDLSISYKEYERIYGGNPFRENGVLKLEEYFQIIDTHERNMSNKIVS